jgi:asparagine synthase (glutamine-hydrolysing)
VDRTARIVLVADARIDNRSDLAAALDLEAPLSEVSDSDLILAAYQKWGEICAERLLGDFSFVVWDERNRKLFCARDPFGTRSFYYYRTSKLFLFASEIKALFAYPGVPKQIDERRIADHLRCVLEDTSGTFYNGILRLPAAHTLAVEKDSARLARYWSLDPKFELKLPSDEAYEEAFRSHFTEAVRCRMRSVGPIGSMLSGGLDSSSITCVARDLSTKEKGEGIHTFSFLFDQVPESDERLYIHAVLAQGGMESHILHADQLNPFSDLDRILTLFDEPYPGLNYYLHWENLKLVQGAGVRVLLDGLFGDDVLSHNVRWYLSDLAYAWRWIALAKELRQWERPGDRSFLQVFGGTIWRDGIKSRLPRTLRKMRQRLRKKRGPRQGSSERPSEIVIRREFQDRVGAHPCEPRPVGVERSSRKSEKERRRDDLSSGLIAAALESVEKGASFFGVENRYPFLDRRLVEFCMALPPKQSFRHGMTRSILRRSLREILPDAICRRSDKGDLSPNLVQALRTHGMKDIEEALLKDSSTLMPYVEAESLKREFDRFSSGHSDFNTMGVMGTIILARWLRLVDDE